jgi:hypothetical protein
VEAEFERKLDPHERWIILCDSGMFTYYAESVNMQPAPSARQHTACVSIGRLLRYYASNAPHPFGNRILPNRDGKMRDLVD